MFKSDIEIAQEAKMSHIRDIAGRFGIAEDELEFYGKYKAKLTDELEKRVAGNKDGKLILVTAINPTPAERERQQSVSVLRKHLTSLAKRQWRHFVNHPSDHVLVLKAVPQVEDIPR